MGPARSFPASPPSIHEPASTDEGTDIRILIVVGVVTVLLILFVLLMAFMR